jgi:hypothetical protein
MSIGYRCMESGVHLSSDYTTSIDHKCLVIFFILPHKLSERMPKNTSRVGPNSARIDFLSSNPFLGLNSMIGKYSPAEKHE